MLARRSTCAQAKYGLRTSGSIFGGFWTAAGLPISSNQNSIPRMAFNEYSCTQPSSTVAYHSIESKPVVLPQYRRPARISGVTATRFCHSSLRRRSGIANFLMSSSGHRFSKNAVTSSFELKPGFASDGYMAGVSPGNTELTQFIGCGRGEVLFQSSTAVIDTRRRPSL